MELDIQQALEDTKSFTVPMSEIKVLSRTEFDLKGNSIKVSATAFKDLLKIVGLTYKTINHLNDTIHNRAGFLVVKELMKAMSTKKGMRICLLISESDREVKRVCLEGESTGSGAAIAPTAIQELVEFATEKNSNVKLTDTFITDGGTKVTFNLRWDVNIPLSMPGEDVKFGKQVSWDLLGDTIISDFAERQVCSNGMTGIVPVKPQSLDSSTTPSDWYKFLFQDLITPNKEMVKSYENRVFEARQTNLSIYEFHQIKSHLVNNWKDDMFRIMRYLGDETWKLDYKKRGINIETAFAGQLRNCPTPVNAWDAINCMTDLASHTYNTRVGDRVKKETQKLAGRLLNKSWDENMHVINTPKYSNAGPQASIDS